MCWFEMYLQGHKVLQLPSSPKYIFDFNFHYKHLFHDVKTMYLKVFIILVVGGPFNPILGFALDIMLLQNIFFNI